MIHFSKIFMEINFLIPWSFLIHWIVMIHSPKIFLEINFSIPWFFLIYRIFVNVSSIWISIAASILEEKEIFQFQFKVFI